MGTGGWLWWIELQLLPNTLPDLIIHVSPIPVHSLKQLLHFQLCIAKFTLVRCFARVPEAGGGTAVQEHQGARSYPTCASSGHPGSRACVFIKMLSAFSVQFPGKCPHVFSAGGREEQHALPRLLREWGSCSKSSGEPGICACTVALHANSGIPDDIEPLLCNALALSALKNLRMM